VDDAGDTLEGALLCVGCGRAFVIRAGVAELTVDLDPETERERGARADTVYDPALERARPYISDPKHPALWPTFAANVEQALDQLEGVPGSVLDVGCATCWSTRMLAQRGHDAVALDISAHMLRAGAAQFASGVRFDRVAADMQRLPFGDATFGAVSASAAIHHAGSLEVVFGEIARVLAPSGRAVLANEPVIGILHPTGAFGAEDAARGMNEHAYRLWEYERAAGRAGLRLRALFPESVARQIGGAIPWPTRLSQAAAPLWRVLPKDWRPRVVGPVHLLVGLPLVAVAEREP